MLSNALYLWVFYSDNKTSNVSPQFTMTDPLINIRVKHSLLYYIGNTECVSFFRATKIITLIYNLYKYFSNVKETYQFLINSVF